MIINLNLKQSLKILLYKVFILTIDLLTPKLSCYFNNLRQKVMRRNIFAALGLSLLLTTTAFSQDLVYNEGQYFTKSDELYKGSYSTFFENGNKEATYTLENGILNGKAEFFFNSGKTQELGFYQNGEKHGEWTRWNNEGVITGKVQYHLGEKFQRSE